MIHHKSILITLNLESVIEKLIYLKINYCHEEVKLITYHMVFMGIISGIICKTNEVWNSQVTKSSYEIGLRKMTSHFELLTRKFLQKFLF